jgi:hypothetical protein
VQCPHIDLERRRCVRLGILGSTLCEIVRESQQAVKLGDGERELGGLEIDLLRISDELEGIMGDELDLGKNLFPPSPEVPNVPEVLDDLLMGEVALKETKVVDVPGLLRARRR